MPLYHGSNVVVQEPRVLTNGHYKDFGFGFGFYCTALERQAQKWASVKRGRSIVNIYKHVPDQTLNVLLFDRMTEEWLDFVAACRTGRKHAYDIVEGPMADDTIWDYVEEFVAGNISREAFWALAKFKHPTHQIVFCTAAALGTLHFEGSYEL